MPFNPRRPDAPPTHGVYVMPPRQGRSSLLGIESAFASLRSPSAQFSFEIYGQDRLISYFVRAQQYPALSGILAACYPQAQLADPQEYRPRNDRSSTDWIDTNAQESLYVLPLYLRHEPYLPLRFYTDQSLARGETDPLASVLGYLSAASAGGLRIGARLLIQPASTKWAHPWQRQLQQRRDRQDLTTPMPTQTRATQSTNRYGETQSADLIPGIPTPLILGLGAVGALGYLGYQLYETGHTAELIAAAATLPFLAAGGYVGYRKLFKKDTVRAYFDEEMAAAKLGAQGFNVELQLLCVLPKRLGKNPAVDALEGLAAVYSQFDNQAGNAWEPGKLRLVEPLKRNPSAGNIHNTLDMGPPAQDRRRMKKTILSPRELGTIWHLPMGEEESALMRRAGSRQLRTYLHGVDEGAMVGYAIGSDDPIHISDQMLRRHMLLLGKSGMGKECPRHPHHRRQTARQGEGQERRRHRGNRPPPRPGKGHPEPDSRGALPQGPPHRHRQPPAHPGHQPTGPPSPPEPGPLRLGDHRIAPATYGRTGDPGCTTSWTAASRRSTSSTTIRTPRVKRCSPCWTSCPCWRSRPRPADDPPAPPLSPTSSARSSIGSPIRTS